jgi:hypothetical protein
MAFLLLELIGSAESAINDRFVLFKHPPTPLLRRLFSRAGNHLAQCAAYFGGGAGVNISRLRPGSGFGFGLGAFFASFLPLSLLPMRPSMTQKPFPEKSLPLDPYLLPGNVR